MMENHKRHSKKHSRLPDKNKSGSLITAAVVIISIGLFAWMIYLSPLGSLIQQHIVEPVVSAMKKGSNDEMIKDALNSQDASKSQETATAAATASPSPTENTAFRSVLTLQETPFYVLQMGTYFQKEAAEERSAQLRTMGAGGVVVEDGAVFRIFAAAYRDEESLMQVQSQVRSDGFEATPYITEQNTVTITLEGEEDALNKAKSAIAFLSDVPNELSTICLSFDRGQISLEETSEELKGFLEQSQDILNGFIQMKNNTMEPILSVIQKYRDSISTFLEERDTISAEDISGALKRLQIETIIDYIRFFDQK